MSASRMNIERILAGAHQSDGVRETIPVPLTQLTLANGAPVTNATAPNLDATGTHLRVLKWDANESEAVYWQTVNGGKWAKRGTDKTMLVRVLARKNNTGDPNTDENTNLALTVTPYYKTASGTSVTAGTAVSVTIPSGAFSGSSDQAGFTWHEFNIGSQLSGVTLDKGSVLSLKIEPNEQVGSSSMILQVLAIELVHRRHVAFDTPNENF